MATFDWTMITEIGASVSTMDSNAQYVGGLCGPFHYVAAGYGPGGKTISWGADDYGRPVIVKEDAYGWGVGLGPPVRGEQVGLTLYGSSNTQHVYVNGVDQCHSAG